MKIVLKKCGLIEIFFTIYICLNCNWLDKIWFNNNYWKLFGFQKKKKCSLLQLKVVREKKGG